MKSQQQHLYMLFVEWSTTPTNILGLRLSHVCFSGVIDMLNLLHVLSHNMCTVRVDALVE